MNNARAADVVAKVESSAYPALFPARRPPPA